MTLASPLRRADEAAALHDAAVALYQHRASRYDLELQPFEPIRRQAIELLALQPGQTVLDLGCGTGLSLAPLVQAVGPSGHVVGVEQCPAMIQRAQQRVAEHGWPGVELLCQPVQDAALQGWADAAIFHFTHDILLSPAALAQVLRHLKPGARVVATGLQWAPPWAWASNLWVWSAAWYSISTLDGLEQPWKLLQAALPRLQVDSTWQGAVFIAHGQLPQPGQSASRSAAQV